MYESKKKRKRKELNNQNHPENKLTLGPDLFKQSLERAFGRQVSDEEAEEMDEILSGVSKEESSVKANEIQDEEVETEEGSERYEALRRLKVRQLSKGKQGPTSKP